MLKINIVSLEWKSGYVWISYGTSLVVMGERLGERETEREGEEGESRRQLEIEIIEVAQA